MKIKSRSFSAVFLFGIIVINIVSGFITNVDAKGLDVTAFATREQLITFNTDDTDGNVTSAKIYFGDNDQEWWIAGTQHGNLVLFSATALMKGIPFELDASSDKTDMTGWADSTYVDGLSPRSVYSTHYGSSHVRRLLKDLEKSYFTNSE